MQETQEMWVWFLCREDPLEEGIATHFSILAWRISWTEEPGGLQSMGSQWVGHAWVANTLSILAWKIPWTRGAWQATFHEATESRTQLSSHVRTRARTHTRTCIHTQTPARTHMCTHTCTHRHTRARAHTHRVWSSISLQFWFLFP